jgi:hypothetical protein
LETLIEELLPEYRGEPMFDVSITLSGRLGDPLGFVSVHMKDGDVEMKGRVAGVRGATDFSSLTTVGASWGPVFAEYAFGNDTLTVGARIPILKLKSTGDVVEKYASRVIGAEIAASVGGQVGVRGGFHLFGAGMAGEARVGWGRGSEALYSDIATEVDAAVRELIYQATRVRMP